MDLRIVLTTVGSEAAADKLAETLVAEKLAACVSVVPAAFSVYRWKDRVEKEPEWLLVIKTLADRVDTLKSQLEALHPYELPEIVELEPSSVSPKYIAWVAEATRKP